MDMIKKLMAGASFTDRSAIATFSKSFAGELKLLVGFTLTFLIALSFYENSHYVKNLQLLKAFHGHKVATLSSPIEKLKKIDIEELIGSTMSYSYEDASLGFYLDNRSFFDKNSKSEVENKLLSSLPSKLKLNASKYVRAILKLAELHQVDPIWVMSVMWTESHFIYGAQSWAGARGLMQIMPGTRKFVYRNYKKASNLLIVEQDGFNINEFFPYRVPTKTYKRHVQKLVNIELGIIYLKSLLKTFKDNHTYATVAYNMGPGWTRIRLRKNLPVGTDNQYLNKVQKAYKQIVRKI
jgi:hypothetical protein